MIWFQAVIPLCLVGVLSPAMIAAEGKNPGTEGVHSVKKVHLSSKQQRQIVGRVMSLVGQTVEHLAEKKRNESNANGPATREPYVPGTYPFDKSRLRVVKHSQLGVAKINYYREGIICSGVHFKPWILLTTADCVTGRDVKRIFAVVTWRDANNGTLHTVPVAAHSVTVHPEYSLGNADYNFALLKIYARFDWDVEEFLPPRTDFTTDLLVNRNIRTFVKEWNEPLSDDSTLNCMNQPVTPDFSLCDLKEESRNWFCVVAEMSSGRSIYKPIDIGSPVYYRARGMKRCLGIYSGRFLNVPVGGHLFHSFYPCIDWIDEFIYEHPLPPMPV